MKTNSVANIVVSLLWLAGAGAGYAQGTTRLTIDAGTADALIVTSSNNHTWRVGPNSGTGSGFGVYDESAGVTRLKIDLNGNLGIGTVSPQAKVDVSGTMKATSFQGDGSGLTGITAIPGGTAGGSLTGTYPSPGIGTGVITDTQISGTANINASKILGGDLAADRLKVGTSHTLLASGATIGGGTGSTVDANASYATIPGGTQARASNYGQQAYASGYFSTPGDAQGSLFVLRGVTTSLTEGELFLDGSSQRIHIPSNGNWAVDVTVVARSGTGDSVNVGYDVKGLIWDNGATLNSAMGVVTVRGIPGAGESDDVTVTHDNPTRSLVIKVKPNYGPVLIRWVATVRTTELIK